MVDFICMGLLELLGARTENYKMKNSCSQLDSNPAPSAKEANSLGIALLHLTTTEHLKFERVLPECAIKINLYHVVDVLVLLIEKVIFDIWKIVSIVIIVYCERPIHWIFP